MNPATTRPALSCFAALPTAVVVLSWLVLLIASLLFRPTSTTAMRLLDRLLVLTSALMFIAIAGVLFATSSGSQQ